MLFNDCLESWLIVRLQRINLGCETTLMVIFFSSWPSHSECDCSHKSSSKTSPLMSCTCRRNCYLCGFTLFCSLILSRTYSLVGELIDTQTQLELIKKGGQSQTGGSADVGECKAL